MSETRGEMLVGLHDCRTNHMEYREGILSFDFPDGICVRDGAEFRKTGAAVMDCRIVDPEMDGILIHIFRESRGKVIREDWSGTFLEAIDRGDFEFEFVTVFRSYQRILIQGYIWFDRRPYHRECTVELHTDEIRYRWEDGEASEIL